MKKQLLEFLRTYLTNDEIRFLSKGWVAVRALGTLVFVVCFISCQDEIEYKGGNEKQQLVISADMAAGQQPACYVCSTTPTLGKVQLDTVWYERTYSDGTTDRYYRMEHPRAFLSDASVRMRFNDGEWHTAAYDTDSKQYLVADYTLSVGDRIELEVNHADLGTATATQTVPLPVTISAVHTTDLYPEITENGWVQFALDIAPYTGASDAFVGIRLRSGAFTCLTTKEVRSKETGYDQQYGGTSANVTYDTVTVLDTVPLTFLYGTGEMWSNTLNTRAQVGKYYGVMSPNYLYLPVTQLAQPRRIALFADQDWNFRILRQDSMRLLNLSIDVDVFSYDYCLYRALAETPGLYDDGLVKAPTGEDSGGGYDNDYDYYVDEILSGITSLGSQEGIQTYTNINGGIGHLGTYAPTQLTIK